MLFLLLLKTVSEFWKCCLPPSNRGQCRWVQPSLSVTQCADELSWDTWINRQINLYSGVCSMSSLSLSFLPLSRCTPLFRFLPKHTLITDLCSWYSHPLAKKRSGSVIAPIQAVFIYVITAASTVKLSFSLLSSQKSPCTVQREIENGDVCLGEKRKLLREREKKNLAAALPLTCLRHLR